MTAPIFTREELVDHIVLSPEPSSTLAAYALAQLDRIDQLERELEIRKGIMDRMPLCQDHRDKFTDKPCPACSLETTERELREAEEAIRSVVKYFGWTVNHEEHKKGSERCDADDPDFHCDACDFEEHPAVARALARKGEW